MRKESLAQLPPHCRACLLPPPNSWLAGGQQGPFPSGTPFRLCCAVSRQEREGRRRWRAPGVAGADRPCASVGREPRRSNYRPRSAALTICRGPQGLAEPWACRSSPRVARGRLGYPATMRGDRLRSLQAGNAPAHTMLRHGDGIGFASETIQQPSRPRPFAVAPRVPRSHGTVASWRGWSACISRCHVECWAHGPQPASRLSDNS